MVLRKPDLSYKVYFCLFYHAYYAATVLIGRITGLSRRSDCLSVGLSRTGF